jgi:hypothetical protein
MMMLSETHMEQGPHFVGSRASLLLRLGIAGPNRPIDDLISRLEQPDGVAWFSTQMSDRTLARLGNGTASLDVATLRELKEVAKNWLGRPSSVDERLRGLLGYFLAVALALRQHDENISSRSVADIQSVLSDLATAIPDPWQSVLAFVSRPRDPNPDPAR